MENGEFQTTLLENLRISNSPKKDAISRAIPIIKMSGLSQLMQIVWFLKNG